VGVDLVELEGWRARALLIARSSPDPARSLRVMRDKAAALFGLGDLRPAIKRQRGTPAPESSTSEATNAQAVGQVGRTEEERPCSFGPAVLEADSDAAAAAVQVVFPSVLLMPRRGGLTRGHSLVGGLVCGVILRVRAAAVHAKEDESLLEGLQLNTKQNGKIKKCITRRVKMKISVISVKLAILNLDGVDLHDGSDELVKIVFVLPKKSDISVANRDLAFTVNCWCVRKVAGEDAAPSYYGEPGIDGNISNNSDRGRHDILRESGTGMFITQLRMAGSDQTFTGQIKPSSQVIGLEDFGKGEDQDEEKNCAEINLEESGVIQEQEQPCAVIRLAYSLQCLTANTQKEHIAIEAIQEEHDGSGSSNTLEATGPGAAGNLTGPMVAPRQEQ
jgi:hypothetical protein